MFTLTKINLLWDKVKALEKNADSSRLPDVTTSDNGDVLTVVEGAWGKAAIPSQLPTVTGADNGNVLGVVEGAWSKMAAPSGGVDYSTSEQDTGLKWIDGKAIYSKTFTAAGGSGNTVTIQTGLSGVDNIIKCEGMATRENDSIYSLPGLNIDSFNYSCSLQIKSDMSELYVKSPQWNPSNVIVTLYYTKASNRRTKK